MKLGVRLMLFNGLLVFLPWAALVVFDAFERGLLISQEETMASQARVLAAALGAFEDPAAGAKGSLDRLAGRTTTRLRVLSNGGRVVADSSRPGTGSATAEQTRATDAPEDPFTTLAYQLGSLPFRVWRALSPPEAPFEAADDDATSANPAVTAALDGRYGSYSHVSAGQRSVTLYAAVPIESSRGVRGVVLASQSTWRTLQALYQIRLALFQIFLASLAAALAVSFVLGLTISRPLKQLRAMAEGFIDQWGRPQGRFRPLRGRDELGDLSRSLVRLGDGLVDHVAFIESFAADLAHELRNPLAAIRSAGELLESGETGERARLAAIILSEVDRIDRLVSLSRDLSRLEVAVARAPRTRLDAGSLVAETASVWRLRGVALVIDQGPGDAAFSGDAGFVRQALDKVVENALDYSPAPGSVALGWAVLDGFIELTVKDRGPGISADRLSQVFERFSTDRRDQGHTGLGLALARAVAEGLGGSVAMRTRPEGGASVTFRYPQL